MIQTPDQKRALYLIEQDGARQYCRAETGDRKSDCKQQAHIDVQNDTGMLSQIQVRRAN